MKKSKIWKIVGAVISISLICALIPTAIVSCGSSNSSNSSSGATTATPLQLEEANYDAFFNNYIKNETNFQTLVTNDLNNSVNNATTNYVSLCNEYNKLTNVNQLDNNIFSSETDINSASGNNLNPNNLWTEIFNFNINNLNNTINLSGTIDEAVQLTNESLSNLTFNKNTFSFEITINLNQYYYTSTTSEFTSNSYQETFKYTNATIAPILLASYANVNSSKIKPVAGWYINSVQNVQFTNENTTAGTTQNFSFSNLNFTNQVNNESILMLASPWNCYQGSASTAKNYLENQFGANVSINYTAGQDWNNLVDLFAGYETNLNYAQNYTYLPVNNPDASLSLANPLTANFSATINSTSAISLLNTKYLNLMERRD